MSLRGSPAVTPGASHGSPEGHSGACTRSSLNWVHLGILRSPYRGPIMGSSEALAGLYGKFGLPGPYGQGVQR